MKTILILGAGTAGTAIAHKLRRRLPKDWDVAIVDPSGTHLYQPGLLFLPFGKETEERILRERGSTLGKGITWHQKTVKAIDTDRRLVELEEGDELSYDFLIIASGTEVRPDMIDGMLGEGWRKNVFDFYTLDGAKALQDALANFDGGRLVINIVEMPIKCPVAPLEFAFLTDDYLTQAWHSRQDRAGLRNAARRRLHETTRLQDPRLPPGRKRHSGRNRVHDRRSRLREERDSLLRRTRGPLRPARHDPAAHGRAPSSRTATSATSSPSCRPIPTPWPPRTSSAFSALEMRPIFRARRQARLRTSRPT